MILKSTALVTTPPEYQRKEAFKIGNNALGFSEIQPSLYARQRHRTNLNSKGRCIVKYFWQD